MPVCHMLARALRWADRAAGHTERHRGVDAALAEPPRPARTARARAASPRGMRAPRGRASRQRTAQLPCGGEAKALVSLTAVVTGHECYAISVTAARAPAAVHGGAELTGPTWCAVSATPERGRYSLARGVRLSRRARGLRQQTDCQNGGASPRMARAGSCGLSSRVRGYHHTYHCSGLGEAARTVHHYKGLA